MERAKLGLNRIAVETTAVAVLADGSTRGETSNRRGRLLELFVAQLLAHLGYDKPHGETINVTKEGIELDVVARHRISRAPIICECKAYSTNIRAPMLSSFLGKFSLARADDPTCQGLFVGLPRLTPEAREQAAAAEEKLEGFRYLGSYEVCDVLSETGLLPSLNDGPALSADPTLVITEHGLALAARELDETSRRPIRWVVWDRSGRPPEPLLDLVERSLADGLPVSIHGNQVATIPAIRLRSPEIVEVKGSTSDFEYQLPAAPDFFVGRESVVKALREKTTGQDRATSIVVNAKSGWGKSSLSLFLQRDIERDGGISIVVDTRTAEGTEFVTAALEYLLQRAAHAGVLHLSDSAAFSSLQSIIETLRTSTWEDASPKPLLIIFDQFENSFRSYDLTQEFRNLAHLVQELRIPLSVAFCWKTDIVGLTEGFPYSLRDEIREVSHVVTLDPFGAREAETLLRRLERTVGAKLHKELRQRLREYSQGFPWLFKKLAGHIIDELRRGVTQEELVRESLNVQTLFESDLAKLSLKEQEALRNIARVAPVVVSELDNSVVPSDVLSSLLHQRLIVQVGDRLDTYWDTFRDFLNTGRVAIEDSYIVRYAPSGPGKLLRAVFNMGGELGVAEAANRLGTSATVVYNYARELRLFGILTTEPNHLVVEPRVFESSDPEMEIRRRVGQALRRHKMHSIAMDLMARYAEPVSVASLADHLPPEFPTVEAKITSWQTYARCFCQWLEYAGLVELRHNGMVQIPDGTELGPTTRLLTGDVRSRLRSGFPGGNPGPALDLLRYASAPTTVARPSANRFRRAMRELLVLGAIGTDDNGRVWLTEKKLIREEAIDTSRLRMLVEGQPGMREAFAVLERDPSCPPTTLGEMHRTRLGAEWAASTTNSVGKYIRAWARACGISTRVRPGRDPEGAPPSDDSGAPGRQESLFP